MYGMYDIWIKYLHKNKCVTGQSIQHTLVWFRSGRQRPLKNLCENVILSPFSLTHFSS